MSFLWHFLIAAVLLGRKEQCALVWYISWPGIVPCHIVFALLSLLDKKITYSSSELQETASIWHIGTFLVQAVVLIGVAIPVKTTSFGSLFLVNSVKLPLFGSAFYKLGLPLNQIVIDSVHNISLDNHTFSTVGLLRMEELRVADVGRFVSCRKSKCLPPAGNKSLHISNRMQISTRISFVWPHSFFVFFLCLFL